MGAAGRSLGPKGERRACGRPPARAGPAALVPAGGRAYFSFVFSKWPVERFFFTSCQSKQRPFMTT